MSKLFYVAHISIKSIFHCCQLLVTIKIANNSSLKSVNEMCFVKCVCMYCLSIYASVYVLYGKKQCNSRQQMLKIKDWRAN